MALMKCPNCKSDVEYNTLICPFCDCKIWKKKDAACSKKIKGYIDEAQKNISFRSYSEAMKLLNSAMREYVDFEKYLQISNNGIDIEDTQCFCCLKSIYLHMGYVKAQPESPHHNMSSAIKDLEHSGDLGEVLGYLNIARLYVQGGTKFSGVGKDISVAKQWYLKAFALDNNNVAINNLGVAYGEDGDQRLGAFYCWCAYKCGNDKALDNYNAYKIYLVAEVQRYIEAINNVSCSNIEELTDDYVEFCSKNADIYNHKQIEKLKKQNKGPIAMPDKPTRKNKQLLAALLCSFTTLMSIFLIMVAIDEGDSFGWWIFLGIFMLIGAIANFSASSKKYKDDIDDYELAQRDFEAYKSKKLLERKQEQERIARVRAQQERDRKALEKAEQEISQKRAENLQKGIPCCPKCASTRIVTMSRGYDWFWGFIGSNEPVNVCQSCGHKFKPGT